MHPVEHTAAQDAAAVNLQSWNGDQHSRRPRQDTLGGRVRGTSSPSYYSTSMTWRHLSSVSGGLVFVS
jgi:hypothetical protein